MERHTAGGRKKQPRTSVIEALAQFRYQIRRFLRFSEKAARDAGITPQQHQLLLGVAGFTGRGWFTISDLAEFLQERHNTVVELVNRAKQKGLVTKQAVARDHRFVRVELTLHGKRLLQSLSESHRTELRTVGPRLLSALQGISGRGTAYRRVHPSELQVGQLGPMMRQGNSRPRTFAGKARRNKRRKHS